MSGYIQDKDVNQINLMPMCLDDMISQDNPVRAIAALVEHMDINSMKFDHSGIKLTGRRSYSPVDMFKLYAYSYYYYTASEFAKCMGNDIVPIVSKSKNEKSAPNKEYAKSKFTYFSGQDAYVCPQGNLLLHKVRKLSSKTPGMRYSNPKACKNCPVKSSCTTNKYRCIFDQSFQRCADEVDKVTRRNMQLYKKRQELVEHPFGSIKRAFLTIGTKNVRTESVLHFLAYNLKRVINIVGVQRMVEVF